jgi:multidrug efflux pump subunit AcrA (membrane-fusion protein)
LLGCDRDAEQTRPRLAPLTESVYASVSIQPEDMYEVYAAVPGLIASISVEEGDTVQVGQPVARIRSETQPLDLENARLELKEAQENYRGAANLLENLRAEIRAQEKQYRLDSLQYLRQRKLWDQQIGSRAELENLELRADQSRVQLFILRRQLQQKERELEVLFARSRNLLAKEQSRGQDFHILAEISGIVYQLLKQEGEYLSSQEPLARIGRGDAFVIDLRVDEVDIARVRTGQQIWISLDAFPGEVFPAVVDRILPMKDEVTQTFRVEGVFEQVPPVLYAGLAGEANIVLRTMEEALLIPVDYLLPGDRVQTPAGEVAIQTGIRNLEWVEVLGGLDTSTIILKP